jgi:hypothetical protein
VVVAQIQETSSSGKKQEIDMVVDETEVVQLNRVKTGSIRWMMKSSTSLFSPH